MRIVKLTEETKKNILENLLKRSPNQYGAYEAAVNEIIENVRQKGDAALFEYTEKFDKARLTPETIQVKEEEIEKAYQLVDEKLLEVIRKALVNIRSYHEKQRQNSWFNSEENGTLLGQKITPMARVGVYVPGGKAVYPSSVLMNVMPAKVAGVSEIIIVIVQVPLNMNHLNIENSGTPQNPFCGLCSRHPAHTSDPAVLLKRPVHVHLNHQGNQKCRQN